MGAPKGNQYALGNNGGRPRKYETPEELAKRVEEYFEYIKGEANGTKMQVTPMGEMEVINWDREPEPATITGLTLFLGFACRAALDDYEKTYSQEPDKKEFSNIIKNARSRVEMSYEKMLYSNRPTGSIFALKNMGWRDQSQVDLTSAGEKIKQPVVKLPDGTELDL